MRVVHVVAQFHPSVGAVEAFVLRLATEQRLAGISAEVVTLDRLRRNTGVRLPASDCVQGVPVRRISFLGPCKYPLAMDVLSYIEPFDIVHVHGTGIFCNLLGLTKFLHRKPLVISLHALGSDRGNRRIRKPRRLRAVTRLSLRRYARVIVSSLNERSLLRTWSKRKVIQIHNGVDADRFADAAARTFAPSFVCFGPSCSKQGIDRLSAAFAELLVAIPEARLHLVCGSHEGLLPALRKRLRGCGLDAAVAIHADPTEAELKDIIARSSFFVSAALDENATSSLVEAVAAGLLPITGRTSAAARVLGAVGPGLLTDFAAPSTAGSEMVGFVREAAEGYGDLRAAAMQLATPYSWPRLARCYVQEYESVLGSRERRIIGVPIRNFTRTQAAAGIDRALQSGEHLNVCFANAHSLNVASTNDTFRKALQHFLVLNDGLGLDIASRIKFGNPFIANLNGTDFVPDFLAMTRHKLRIYLVGTTDQIVAQAARKFQTRFPWHSIVGWRNGFFTGLDDIEETCRSIRAANADCVLVGMGNPLQELWIAEHGAKTGARLLFGVGALFDFEAGRVSRAPQWVRHARCEWIYRLLQEPQRLLRRYLIGNVTFLIRVIADARG